MFIAGFILCTALTTHYNFSMEAEEPTVLLYVSYVIPGSKSRGARNAKSIAVPQYNGICYGDDIYNAISHALRIPRSKLIVTLLGMKLKDDMGYDARIMFHDQMLVANIKN